MKYFLSASSGRGKANTPERVTATGSFTFRPNGLAVVSWSVAAEAVNEIDGLMSWIPPPSVPLFALQSVGIISFTATGIIGGASATVEITWADLHFDTLSRTTMV